MKQLEMFSKNMLKEAIHFISIFLLLGLFAFIVLISVHLFNNIFNSPKAVDYVEEVRFQEQRVATSFIVRYKNRLYTVTNRHVCDIAENGYINIKGRKEKVLKIANDTDLCLVNYKGDKDNGLIIDSTPLNNLDTITQIGFAGGGAKEISIGLFREYDIGRFSWIYNIDKAKEQGYEKRLTILAMIGVKTTDHPRIQFGRMWLTCKGGCSGSPILDNDNKVRGVLFAGSPDFPKDTLMIPSHTLVEFLEEYLRE